MSPEDGKRQTGRAVAVVLRDAGLTAALKIYKI
jgi:hypothetical protein